MKESECYLPCIHIHQLLYLDEDKFSGMVFVDFRKAYDVVDHQLLLTKLRLYRVSDPSLSCLNHIFLVANSLSVLMVKDQTVYLSSKRYRKEVS